MQNKMSDLNNYLFAQIERLDDDELSAEPDKLRAEIERTNAICNVAERIVSNNALILKARLTLANGLEGRFDVSGLL